MAKKKKNSKGFTLIEVLAVIVIVSLVMGIVIPNILKIVNNSDNKSVVISENNIKKSARYYVKENNDEVVWTPEINSLNNTTGNIFTCVSKKSLVNKGYLSQKDINTKIKDKNGNLVDFNYVKIWKDSNNTIYQEDFDEENNCNNRVNVVPIPNTSICNKDVIYNGENQSIVDITKLNSKIEIFNNSNIKKNAGMYSVELKLINNDIYWEDGSNSNKYVNCSIQKATPTIYLTPWGEEPKNIESSVTRLTSNVEGTISSIKSSNNEIATAKPINNNGSKEIDINIIKYATRKTNTYITINFTPSDNNYNNTSVIYTIGENKKEKVNITTTCNNLTYNGSNQKLINDTNIKEYILINNYGVNAGNYQVIAKLKWGYMWNDNTLTDKTITCNIKKATPNLTLEPSSVTLVKNNSADISALSTLNGIFSVSSNTYVTSTVKTTTSTKNTLITLTGKNVTNSTNVIVNFKPTDNDNYEEVNGTITTTVLTDTYKLIVNANGGEIPPTTGWTNSTNNKTSSKNVKYNNPIGDLPTPTKAGYNFAGWYTETTNGTLITKDSIFTEVKNTTIYAHWTPKTYTISLNQQSGGGTNPTTIYYQYKATKVIKNITCYYYKDSALTDCLGGGYNLTELPTRTGYTFGGFYSETEGKGTQYINTKNSFVNNLYQKMPSEINSSYTDTITLYAKWTIKSFTLTANANGGEIPTTTGWTIATDKKTATKSINYNNQYGTLPTPTRTGYSIADWYTAASGGNKVSTTTTLTGNTTIYAHWTINKYKFDVNLDAGIKSFNISGVVDAANNLTDYYKDNNYGTQGTISGVVANTGYHFSSYSVSGQMTNEGNGKFKLGAGNGVVTINSAANTYTIKFDSNGGTGSTSATTCTYDANCTLTSNGFSKSGYTFNGWKNGSNTYTDGQSVKNLTNTNNGTVTLTAQWKINQYKFDVNLGTGIKSFNISGVNEPGNNLTDYYKDNNYGTQGTISGVVANTGYYFSGYSVSGQMTNEGNGKFKLGAGNGVVTINGAANTYTIKFTGNGNTGGSTSATTCTYDTDCTLTANGFTKTGYKFTGWKIGETTYSNGAKVKNLTSTNNGTVTLTAQWTLTSVKIHYCWGVTTGEQPPCCGSGTVISDRSNAKLKADKNGCKTYQVLTELDNGDIAGTKCDKDTKTIYYGETNASGNNGRNCKIRDNHCGNSWKGEDTYCIERQLKWDHNGSDRKRWQRANDKWKYNGKNITVSDDKCSTSNPFNTDNDLYNKLGLTGVLDKGKDAERYIYVSGYNMDFDKDKYIKYQACIYAK